MLTTATQQLNSKGNATVANDCIVHHGFIKLVCIHNSRGQTIIK
jgi:hypothetical protein